MPPDRRDRRSGIARGAEQRSPFARDRDCLRHSPALQRLRGITQVMPAGDPGQFQNRLTHSLAVARIGHTIAERLLASPESERAAMGAGGLDPLVVEAACLAHDLGHPPFGHVGEAELDRLLTQAGVPDGFEANAQAFRVVRALGDGSPETPDFDLTRATTAAMLKYPWRRSDAGGACAKWGAYETEAADLTWARALAPDASREPTLEAAIMDWADEIAYAVLDFADFTRAGLIPLPRLLTDQNERDRFLRLVVARRRIPPAEHETLARLLERLLQVTPPARSSPNGRRSTTEIATFADSLIASAAAAPTIATLRSDGSPLLIDPETRLSIVLLEGLTRHYVIDSPALIAKRTEQAKIIRTLFAALADVAPLARVRSSLPESLQSRLQRAETEKARLRNVADAIAAMDERQAVALAGCCSGR
jgi:dGTPase